MKVTTEQRKKSINNDKRREGKVMYKRIKKAEYNKEKRKVRKKTKRKKKKRNM